jgi:hypothetical protein
MNESTPHKEHQKEKPLEEQVSRPSQNPLVALQCLDEMINNLENLPPYAMIQPVSHYDWLSLLLIIRSVLRASNA